MNDSVNKLRLTRKFPRFQYFIDDSLKQVSWTDAAGAALSPPTATVSYTYETAYPRVATMIDGIGTTQYGYNPITAPPVLGAGRVATVDGPWANDTIGYTYDALGRVTQRAINGGANTTTLAYDTLGRANAVTNPLGAFAYAYDGVTERLDHVDYPNGQKTQMAYFDGSGARRLRQIKHTDSTTAVISQFDYTYNAGGNIQTWTQNDSGLTHPRVYTFGYDGIDQLTAATLKDTVTSATLREQAYRYDAGGNRTTVQDGNTVATETSNALNQLKAVSGGGMMRFAGTLNEAANVTVGGNPATVRGDNTFEGFAAVAGSGTTRVPIVATDIDANVTSKYVDVRPDAVGSKALTYDANGNTTSNGGTQTYEWDAADRLVAINYTGTTRRTEFGYDGLSRWVSNVEKDGATVTSEKHFVWEDFVMAEERDNSNTTVKRFYAEGEQRGVSNLFYTRDHLRSVREVANDAAVLQVRYDYDSWGRRTKLSGTVDVDFGFTGHYQHASSGLHLAPLRAYDSNFGRWLSRDPIEEDGGLNLYGYVENSAVSRIDPLGLSVLGYIPVSGVVSLNGNKYGTTAGVVSALKYATPGSITSVNFVGHGSSSLIQIGSGSEPQFLTVVADAYSPLGYKILTDTEQDITDIFIKALSPNASIHLSGCDTASAADPNNIAKVISKLVPKASVTGNDGPTHVFVISSWIGHPITIGGKKVTYVNGAPKE